MQENGATLNDNVADANPIIDYRITAHARDQMTRRQIAEVHVANVLATPEQTENVREGREVYQSRIESGDGELYLLRVFVDTDRAPPEVVTVYRTSRVAKYWRTEE